MRMWLCDPEIMCQQHLCGEHVEMHMYLGTLKKGYKVDGYLKNNCFQPRYLFERHEELKKEMVRRGYNHQSNMRVEECSCVLDLPNYQQYWVIDKEQALNDLLERCLECRKRFDKKRMVGGGLGRI